MMARLITGVISGIVFLTAVFVPVPGFFAVMVGLVLSLAARELAEPVSYTHLTLPTILLV